VGHTIAVHLHFTWQFDGDLELARSGDSHLETEPAQGGAIQPHHLIPSTLVAIGVLCDMILWRRSAPAAPRPDHQQYESQRGDLSELIPFHHLSP
jgi:hypothetical protein